MTILLQSILVLAPIVLGGILIHGMAKGYL